MELEWHVGTRISCVPCQNLFLGVGSCWLWQCPGTRAGRVVIKMHTFNESTEIALQYSILAGN
jgi:hypothetical protein